MMQDSADENGCKVMTITHIYSFGPSELKRGGGGMVWELEIPKSLLLVSKTAEKLLKIA
jgi:hypothetical protein